MHLNPKYQEGTDPAVSSSVDHGVWIPKSQLKVIMTSEWQVKLCLRETLKNGLLMTVQFVKYVLLFLKIYFIEVYLFYNVVLNMF